MMGLLGNPGGGTLNLGVLKGIHMSYGLNVGWGENRGLYRVLGGDLLRDVLQISSRAHIPIHAPSMPLFLYCILLQF